MATFFIIIPPGLEITTKKELIFLNENYFNFALKIKHETVGGIEVECDLLIGLTMNTVLKTASRILLRIDHFKVKDAPKLFHKICKIQWSHFLISNDVKIEVSCHESRLFDSRKITKCVEDGIKHFIIANPLKKKYIQLYENSKFRPKIYIRIDHDLCTVSIDTTGELLHFRGLKPLTGLAPIRENLAMALLTLLTENLDISHYQLIDPMCGSGTFLIEAASINSQNSRRSYAFHFLPIYQMFLNQNMAIIPITRSEKKFNKLIGFDLNPEIVELCKKNVGDLEIKIDQSNIFEMKSNQILDGNNLVIVNPPYGIRVTTNEEINSKYFIKLTEAICQKYSPLRIGMIVPSEYTYNLPSHFNMQIINKTKLKNGGIPITFYLLETK